jgi:hypothetical protein
MEIIWFISPGLVNAKEKIGDISTSYIINKKTPKNTSSLKHGDIIKFAEKGYGIWKTCKIRSTNILKIETIEFLNELRRNIDPFLVNTYFREKYNEAVIEFKNGNPVYCFITEHEIIDLEENTVKLVKGIQGSIHLIDNNNIKVLPDKPMISLINNSFEESGFVPGKLINECRALYSQIEEFSVAAILGHIDHIVPNSLGGPGCILENLMPLDSKKNIVKSNVTDKPFFSVAAKWNLRTNISSDFLDSFNLSDRKRQKDIVTSITKEIWERPLNQRRKFYWDVRSEIYPFINFNLAYEKAGIKLDF